MIVRKRDGITLVFLTAVTFSLQSFKNISFINGMNVCFLTFTSFSKLLLAAFILVLVLDTTKTNYSLLESEA